MIIIFNDKLHLKVRIFFLYSSDKTASHRLRSNSSITEDAPLLESSK